MKKLLVGLVGFGMLALAGLFIASDSLPPEARNYSRADGPRETRLQNLMIEYELPSLSIAIATQGKTVWRGVAGYADIAMGRRATTQTLYSIGSVAKPLTAVALMRAVQQGHISLDQQLNDAIPGYGQYGRGVTARQLASHTAGITHSNWGRFRQEFVTKSEYQSPAEALRLFSDVGLQFIPGTDFAYSSNGYIALSAMLASAFDGAYLDVMHEEVLAPLGMTNTLHHKSENTGPHEAQDYFVRLTEHRWVPRIPTNRSFLFGGGGYLSTPSDLVNFGIGVLDSAYLSQDMRESMFQPVDIPDANGNAVSNPQNYALGWRVSKLSDKAGRAWFGVHHGGTVAGGASSYLLVFPEHNAAIAFATNAQPSSKPDDHLRSRMWHWLIDELQGVNSASNDV